MHTESTMTKLATGNAQSVIFIFKAGIKRETLRMSEEVCEWMFKMQMACPSHCQLALSRLAIEPNLPMADLILP